METIFINDTAFVVNTAVAGKVMIDGGNAAAGDTYTEDGTIVDPTLQTGAGKDSLLTSWPFVIGLSTGVLLISIVLGVLLAKMKIKKGIDLYED